MSLKPPAGGDTDAFRDAAAPSDEMVDSLGPTALAVGAAKNDDGAALDEAVIGRSIGFYRVLDLLGAGGMGRVYRAHNDRLQRVCALKLLDPDLARAEPDRLDLLWTEACAAAKLNHPNVVAVHSLGEADGYCFIEMEYIDGPSLGQRLAERRKLDAAESTRLVEQVAGALHLAHANNLLHCDVKPDNILLQGGRVAKLGDFGLAKAFGAGQRRVRTGGTPYYMSPELFAGGPPTAASDIYALGATYYALLVGEVPYPAHTLRDLKAELMYGAVPRPSARTEGVPDAMCDLIRAMLAKDPAERPDLDPRLLAQLGEFATRLRPTADIVREAFAGTNVVWTQRGPERFSFVVPLTGARQQTIEAETAPNETFGRPAFACWTPCAPASAEQHAAMLELNGRLPFGAIGIRPHQGVAHFVMACNLPRGTLAPAELRAAALQIAEWADIIERQLTGEDRF